MITLYICGFRIVAATGLAIVGAVSGAFDEGVFGKGDVQVEEINAEKRNAVVSVEVVAGVCQLLGVAAPPASAIPEMEMDEDEDFALLASGCIHWKGPASASDLSTPAKAPSTGTGASPAENPIAGSSSSLTKPMLLAWAKPSSSTGTRVWNPIAGSFAPSQTSGGNKPIPQGPQATATPKASRTDSGWANPPMGPPATSSMAKQTNPSPLVASSSHSVSGAKSKPQTVAAAAASSAQPTPTGTSPPTIPAKEPSTFVINDYAQRLKNAEAVISDLTKDLPHIHETLASNAKLEAKTAELEALVWEILQKEEKNAGLASENALMKSEISGLQASVRAAEKLVSDNKKFLEMIANHSVIQELGTKRANPESGHDESGSPSKRAPLSQPKPAAPSADRAVRLQTSEDVVYIPADDE
ncbi:hypothetical protein HDU98_010814 [Podochytrium sp. JEL0797]|nr:hypothetical protein HDU98_010814 [Podochytrium sp. JEL0797]